MQGATLQFKGYFYNHIDETLPMSESPPPRKYDSLCVFYICMAFQRAHSPGYKNDMHIVC